MSTGTPINSLYDLDFPPLPSAIDGKSGTKSSLAPVIHSSFSGWDPEKSSSYIQRSIEVRNATARIPQAPEVSPITDAGYISESETGYGSDMDDGEREVHSRNYLDERSDTLADEYFRKMDFAKEKRQKF